jgi:hypothetical protein
VVPTPRLPSADDGANGSTLDMNRASHSKAIASGGEDDDDDEMSYEEQKVANVARNQALLRAMGLVDDFSEFHRSINKSNKAQGPRNHRNMGLPPTTTRPTTRGSRYVKDTSERRLTPNISPAIILQTRFSNKSAYLGRRLTQLPQALVRRLPVTSRYKTPLARP